MILTRAAYQAALEAGTLKLAFVGMSNIGKSYASRAIGKAYGLPVIDNDALIGRALGLADMQALADWMHYPDRADHASRAKTYIKHEDNILAQTLARDTGGIYDLTGSVIYCHEAALEELKQQVLVVHIAAQHGDLTRLEQLFFDNPKPLIWHGQFTQQQDQDANSAMRESYPRLLKSRQTAYQNLSDVSIKSSKFRNLSGKAMANLIGQSLPTD